MFGAALGSAQSGHEVTRCKTEVGVVKLVAAVCLVPPRVRATGRDEAASAVFARLVEATNAPQESIARSRELRV